MLDGESIVDQLTEGVIEGDDSSHHPHILIKFLLAALVPYVVEVARYLVEVMWPNSIYLFITRFLLRREVALVEDFQKPDSTQICKELNNAVLVDAITLYCAHLNEKAKKMKQREDVRRQSNDSIAVAITKRAGARNFFTSDIVPHAEFRYAPKLLGENEKSTNRGIASSSQGAVIADVLKNDYMLFVIPTGESAMEVEPGLFVRFEDQTVVQEERNVEEEGEAETEEQKLNARIQRDFWMSDLVETLRDGGATGKVRRPFDRYSSETEEENDSEETDSDVSDDDDRGAPEPQPARRIFLRCCEIRGAQRETYARWYEEEGKRERRQGRGPAPHLFTHQSVEEMVDVRNRIDLFIARAQRWYDANRHTSDVKDADRYVIYAACSELQAAVQEAEGESMDESEDSCDWYDNDDSTEYNGPILTIRRFAIGAEQKTVTKASPFSPTTTSTPSPLGISSSPPPAGLCHSHSFESLFFPQKRALLQLIHGFVNGTGVYARPGMPQRLHVLITSNVCGAGTTSIVKAVAHELRRSIVSLSLGTILTNSYFKTWLTTLRAKCYGERMYEWVEYEDTDYEDESRRDVHMMVQPSNVVYLVEDIDRIGSDEWSRISDSIVAQLRDNASNEELLKGADKEKEESSSESDGDADEETTSGGSTGEDSDSDEDSDENSDDDSEKAKRKKQKKQERMEMILHDICSKFSKNKLTVEGVIETLQPRIASPQRRVVILTSSQPHLLDRRWLSPLLINIHVKLDFMAATEVIEMMQHHGFSVSPAEEGRVRRMLRDDQRIGEVGLLPAVLQEYCAESKTAAEIIDRIEHATLHSHF